LLLLLFCIGAKTPDNFYLDTRIVPEKLIPTTLSLTLSPDESARISVDVLPRGADVSRLTWSLESESGCAKITWDGDLCTVHAVRYGSCVLTVSDPDGANASVKITVAAAPLHSISLTSPNNTLAVGDELYITAQPEPADAEVIWNVRDGGHAAVSYGGKTCRVRAISPGEVHVRASIGGFNAASEFILAVTSPPRRFIGASVTTSVLVLLGCTLLLVSFVFWRRRG
ncbi:MAG: hypothetical protein RSC43_05075, partial [Clostridia bacterium]